MTMQQPITKYILGFLLFTIWGVVAYKVYSKANSNTNIELSIPSIKQNHNAKSSQPFTLLVNYRDPFLDDQIARPKVARQTPPPSHVNRKPQRLIQKEKASAIKAVQFPDIKYKGNIRTKAGRAAALVNIQGAFINWGEGEQYMQMKLEKIYTDSIKIAYKGAAKTIGKHSK